MDGGWRWTPRATRPAPPSRHQGRCQIPDWFAELLADARHDLAEAEHTVESRAAERARRAAAIAAVEGDLADIDRATAPHREMLAVDAKRADQACSTHAAAERRLADGGRRGRREARRELDIAERVLERTTATLERTRQRVAPDLERYRAAVTNVEDARTDLRRHDLATQLDSFSRRLTDLTRTVAALDTWQRRANGDTITVAQLHDTVEVLTTAPGTDHGEQHRALGHAIQSWAGTAGIDLQIADRRSSTLEHTGLELGL